jgi:hypothetical protein
LAKPFIGAIDQDHPCGIIALVHAVDELLKFGRLIITPGHRRSRQSGECLHPLQRESIIPAAGQPVQSFPNEDSRDPRYYPQVFMEK